MSTIHKIHFDSGIEMSGFSMSNAPNNHFGWICQQGTFTSDHQYFYRIMEETSRVFFYRNKIHIGYISNFLVIIHNDTSADVYFGDLPLEIEYRFKKTIKKGDVAYEKDIADIRRLKFSGIEIQETDKVVCCLKVKWKFLFFVDFAPEGIIDVDLLCKTLGNSYGRLQFEYIYKIVENPILFEKLKNRGWFPFIELIGSDLKTLYHRLEDDFLIEDYINELISKFDQNRIEQMTQKWWLKPVYNGKRKLLEAGIEAFNQNSDLGNINCINTLIIQLEGILRKYYQAKINSNFPKMKITINEILKSIPDTSLSLPRQFADYLNDIIFANFDPKSGSIDITRHSAAHGFAEPEKYTREIALQIILSLDQIYYYFE